MQLLRQVVPANRFLFAVWMVAVLLFITIGIEDAGAARSKRVDLYLAIIVPTVAASWVVDDARIRGRQLCYDYGSFVFFAWPFIVPIYLFQTRGCVRAFLIVFTFLAVGVVVSALTVAMVEPVR